MLHPFTCTPPCLPAATLLLHLQPDPSQDEVLAAQRDNKLLVCDLTGSDDEAPRWRAEERPVHAVD